MAEPELRRLVRREMTILKYVDFRFRTEVRVTDAEVQKAYDEKYGSSPRPPSLVSVAESLRLALEDQQVGQAVDGWVKELRSAADIRYQGP